MDDVQLIRRGWHYRNKIKSRGEATWLTVPVQRKGKSKQRILEARIDNSQEWRHRVLTTFQCNYARAPYYKEYFPSLAAIIATEHEYLVDLNIELLDFLISALAIDVEVVRASTLGISSKRSDYLADVVAAVGGQAYLSGRGARDYLDEEVLMREGIGVYWQDFYHPVYPQVDGGFVANLSAIDLVLNCGPDGPRILRESQRAPVSGVID